MQERRRGSRSGAALWGRVVPASMCLIGERNRVREYPRSGREGTCYVDPRTGDALTKAFFSRRKTIRRRKAWRTERINTGKGLSIIGGLVHRDDLAFVHRHQPVEDRARKSKTDLQLEPPCGMGSLSSDRRAEKVAAFKRRAALRKTACSS